MSADKTLYGAVKISPGKTRQFMTGISGVSHSARALRRRYKNEENIKIYRVVQVSEDEYQVVGKAVL